MFSNVKHILLKKKNMDLVRHWWQWLVSHSYIMLVIGVLAIFWTNTRYVTYPDEFVNLLAGKYLLAGKAAYREFFDHHLPFAWFLGATLLAFSFGSYVKFRILWALFQFGLLLWTGLYIRRTNKEVAPFYWVFFCLYPFITVYYWTHLFLADSLASLFFSISTWLLFTETYTKGFRLKTMYAVVLASAALVLSSLTYVYTALVLYAWVGYLLFREKRSFREWLNVAIAAIAPYMGLLLYLVLTGSLRDFYISNFVYNTKLYISIPNYTKGTYFNPLKFGLTMIFNFYDKYFVLLTKIRHVDIFFPVSTMAGLGTLLLLILLGVENWMLAVLFFFLLSFSAPRSNVYTIGETDYQSNIFVMLGFIATLLVFFRAHKQKWILEAAEMLKKVSTVLLLVYLFFSAIFLIKNTYDKWYFRYTQKMPGIFDLSYTSDFLHKIIDDTDYYWVGPYEPHEMFFMRKGKLPGKYISLLPQFREDDYFKNSFIAQFEKNMPTIIIYKHEASIFMTPADEFGKFFLEWMKGKYVNLEELKLVGQNSPSSFNVKGDVYIKKSEMPRILKRLNEYGYIQKM